MKFEKFFKSAGTHGLIVKKNDNENWLVCAGVGMRIPDGINNLGVATAPHKMFTAIVNSPDDSDRLELAEAVLKEADGRASDIIRVFDTELGDRVGIYNGAYGLLEKRDRLTYLEIEDDDPDSETEIAKFIVVRDNSGEAVGFLRGVDEI